jgi:hypothetical protein
VPTIIIRSGDATGQYMFAQPRKWPPSVTTTRSRGGRALQQPPICSATERGSRRPSGASGSPLSRARRGDVHALAPAAGRGILRRQLVAQGFGDEAHRRG